MKEEALKFTILFIIIYLVISLFISMPNRVCVSSKEIISIDGGCNKYGTCAVTYNDGSHGRDNEPYFSKKVCFERKGYSEFKWKFWGF